VPIVDVITVSLSAWMSKPNALDSSKTSRRRLADVFTPVEREQLRNELIKTAHADNDVVGAALVGSAATGREDAWSDIDLALQVGHDADPATVASRWTAQFYDRHGAAHHLDILAGGVLYRVFLLASSLQIDVSFWPVAGSELARSHAALVRALADEVAFHDRELSTQLNAPLDELARAGY
jgi:predicted nucleotidyltransferase